MSDKIAYQGYLYCIYLKVFDCFQWHLNQIKFCHQIIKLRLIITDKIYILNGIPNQTTILTINNWTLMIWQSQMEQKELEQISLLISDVAYKTEGPSHSNTEAQRLYMDR